MAKTLFELWTPEQRAAWYKAVPTTKKLLAPYVLKVSRGEIPISEWNKMAWKYGGADLMVKEETPKPKPVSKPKPTPTTTTYPPKTTPGFTPQQLYELGSQDREKGQSVSKLKNVYTVKPGDTLSGIAAKYGMDWKTLHKANPQIKNPNLIYPNQQISIPTSTTTSTTPDLDPNKVYYLLYFKNGVVDKVYGTKRTEEKIRKGIARLATQAEYEKAEDFHSRSYSLWKSETGGKGSFPDWIKKNWRHYVLGEPKSKTATTGDTKTGETIATDETGTGTTTTTTSDTGDKYRDFLLKQIEQQNQYLRDYIEMLKSQPSPIDIYKQYSEQLGLPQQQQQLAGIQRQVLDVEELLDKLESDINARISGKLVTEAQRRRYLATEAKPLREQLADLMRAEARARTGYSETRQTLADMLKMLSLIHI